MLSLIGVLCPQGAKAHPPVETKGHRLNKRDWKTTLRLRQPYRANSKGAALHKTLSAQNPASPLSPIDQWHITRPLSPHNE